MRRLPLLLALLVVTSVGAGPLGHPACAQEAGGVNGRKIRLVVYDDGGAPQEALAAVRRLIDQDRVFALVGGSTSGATLPVLPLINRAKIPFMASISSNRRL